VPGLAHQAQPVADINAMLLLASTTD
jgi:hypothetical protein